MDYSLEQNDVWELVELSELLHQKELWILVLLFLICVANANKFRVGVAYAQSIKPLQALELTIKS